jgi:hypothetical protein
MTVAVWFPAIGAILGRVDRRIAAASTVTAALLCAAPAAAQQPEPGLHLDPNSPSAKEYAVPLEEARREADPSRELSDPVVPGSRESPPFGDGITSDESQESSSGAGSGRDRGGGDGRGDGRGDEARSERKDSNPLAETVVAEAAARPGAPPGDRGSIALVVGAGSLVLAVGALTGALLRRRTRR